MGYTHYWYRPREIPQNKFAKIVEDFKEFLPLFKVLGVRLANGLGEGEPVINHDEVIFNGYRRCGHPKRNLGIAWASPIKPKTVVALGGEAIADQTWFAGSYLNSRMCDGDCSHETFWFPRIEENAKNGQKHFSFCKTAFKPYDFAVCVFLIIAKHHLGKELLVRSDGEICNWQDAIDVVRNHMGYKFKFDN